MGGDFWYPFFPAKFRSATRHLTAEQDGIYRRLLDEYMETRSPLPDSDIALSRIAGVSEIKWLDAARILRAYFRHADGMLFHDFCDKQLDIQDKKNKYRSASAQKAAETRWSKIKQDQQLTCGSHAERNADAMRNHATNTNTNTYSKEKITKVIQKKKTEIEKPDDVSESVWQDFILLRKNKKAPVTETVISGYRKEAQKAGIGIEEAMRHSILMGWQGFKSDWYLQKNTKEAKNDRIKRQYDEVLDRIRAESATESPGDLVLPPKIVWPGS